MSHGYYEKNRDDDKRILIHRSRDHTYPAHFHTHLELFLLKSGEYTLTLDGKSEKMQGGDIAVIDSFTVHGYRRTREVADDCVVIIPFDRLHGFWKNHRADRIENPVFRDRALCEELLGLIDQYLVDTAAQTREAGAQLLLARLLEHLRFSPSRGGGERLLLREILSYIQEHFRKPLTRADIALALGYTESHISRVFCAYVGKGLSQYVNDLRLQYIERQRQNGDTRPVTDLIFEAGFGSQQTYYRAKKGAKV